MTCCTMAGIMPAIFEYRHTVCDDEIDALGHANNVCYVRWTQDAAVAHSAVQGRPAEAYQRLGSGWVVRSHAIEYRQPAQAGDRIVVETWVAAFKRVTSLRRYRIVRPADVALLATAETDWAFINFATGQPMRMPVEIAQAFRVVAESPIPDHATGNLNEGGMTNDRSTV